MTDEQWEAWQGKTDSGVGYHTDNRRAGARLADALSIISECSKDGDLCAEHDVIYLPGGSECIEKMTEEQADRLHSLGMHWSTEGDCWAMFT